MLPAGKAAVVEAAGAGVAGWKDEVHLLGRHLRKGEAVRIERYDLAEENDALKSEIVRYRVALVGAKSKLDKCRALPEKAAEAYQIIVEALEI